MTGVELLMLVVILFCLLLSFFFSGSETALTASSRATMHRLAKDGNARAATVNRLMEMRERMIGALLLGNNIANIVAATLMTAVLIVWFGDIGVFYATIVMTALVVVFTEVLPKTVALNVPDRVSLLAARPIELLVRLFTPVLIAIEAIVRWTLRAVGFRIGEQISILSPHEAIRGTVDMLHHEGSVEKRDRDMLGGLLDLRDLEVSDVMLHRTEMITVCADEAPEQVVKAVLDAPVTRVPLWSGRPENFIGVLHAKDLLRAIQAADGEIAKVDVRSIARAPWFVPDVRPLSEQLKAFLRRKTQLALVVDEYGEVMGLLTLEDILEEIVGDIVDEHDIALPGVQQQPDGAVNVDGGVPIRDLNRVMDWNLPDEEATTVAGLVIHEARSIPEAGQVFTFHGFRFRVLRRERNRITALRITPLAPRKPVAKAG